MISSYEPTFQKMREAMEQALNILQGTQEECIRRLPPDMAEGAFAIEFEPESQNKYKRPYIILLSFCDQAISALEEKDYGKARDLLQDGLDAAENAWIEEDEKERPYHPASWKTEK